MSSQSLSVTNGNKGETVKVKKKKTLTLPAKESRELVADVLKTSKEMPRLNAKKTKRKGQYSTGDLSYRLRYTSAGKYVVARLLLDTHEILQVFYNPQGFVVTVKLPNAKLKSMGLDVPEERTATKPGRKLPQIISLINFREGEITIKEDQTLSARGIRKDLEKLYRPYLFIHKLFNDNKFETLRKVGMPIKDMQGWYYDTVVKEWYRQAVKMYAAGKRYDIWTWIDCMRLLKAAGRDINNPSVYLPDDIDAFHNQLVKKQEKTMELQRRRERIEADKAYLASISKEDLEAYKDRMARFAAISLGDGQWRITTLTDIADHFQDAQSLQHCLFHSRYFEKNGTLVVRVCKESQPQKTYANAEIDFHTGEIYQLYGKLNGLLPPAEDKAIKDLIRHNIKKYLNAGKKTASRPKLAVETFTPAFN